MRRLWLIASGTLLLVLLGAPFIPSHVVAAQGGSTASPALRGGPWGMVKTSAGVAVDGLMVQLISKASSIRTTVYTDEVGRFEFPPLAAGEYALRIPRPLEFHPYVKEGVRINGAARIDDIVVQRITESEFLPPLPELLPQLTAAEWMANMPGTAQEKRLFLRGCSIGCHSLDYPFRVKHDAASWRKLLNRMIYYQGRMAIGFRKDPVRPTYLHTHEEAEIVINWIARIRGLDSEIPPIKPFQRPTGPSTRAVVTEYDLPWAPTRVHDVAGDADGQIWFTINRSPFVGKLDPQTGTVVSFRIPNGKGTPLHPEPDVNIEPGLHWLDIDRKTGAVWFSYNWAGSVGRLDPKTGDVRLVHTGVSGNLGLSPDGQSVMKVNNGKISKFDARTMFDTGKPVQEWPLKSVRGAYGNFFSADGRYFGAVGPDFVRLDLQTGELIENTSRHYMGSGRGSFDPEGNLWAGGKSSNGGILKFDPKTGATVEYVSPTPHVNGYSAKSDKNGDIWAGMMQSGRISRFKPKTGTWIEYVLPTPHSFDFNSWIDNSTTPPTYWYGDDSGYIVRIQPLE
ncbi:MAG: hypothetical protein A3F70_18880 [Acidobacteria bacterium RIFCSPLOWO2_12_FULL_67_14]|nr:MAG: hypothetical protein A3H29_03610 [Acidobacteria bacterium RIFCSPLOWO2_02_FULL_67_21]OFW35716.1 MAG: hypothetical protein A3F70_18880 [Acidobacteria bacterium RIFCSPLOWO2_12_FULL_67_14]